MAIDVSVGAIGAAVIAGLVSLIGLIISKEQKTSEFRQAWIDDLRKEIVTFTTNINSVADALTAGFSNQQEKVKTLSPLYSALNSSIFAIKLRLNPEEKLSKEVLSCFGRFNALANDESKIKASNIRPIEKDLLDKSAELLKYEWVRVKEGERTFRITKVILAVFVIIATILLIVAFMFGDGGKAAESDKAPSVTTIVNEAANSSVARAGDAIQKPNAAGASNQAKREERGIRRQPVRRSSIFRKLHSSEASGSSSCPVPATKTVDSDTAAEAVSNNRLDTFWMQA